MSLDETYQFDEKTEMDEGQDAMDDIDAFEARMRGEAKAPAKPLQTRVRPPGRRHCPFAHRRTRPHPMSQDNKPKPAANPMKKGSAYVAHAGARAVTKEHPPKECPPPRACNTAAHPRACLPLTVKAPKMTDAQHDAEEAMSAVSDLDKFDRQHA